MTNTSKSEPWGISGSWLKVIAIIAMFADHASKYWFSNFEWCNHQLFQIGGFPITVFFVLSSVVGRLAFPIFAFLLVEGYSHTRSFKSYALNLLVFALISIIPYNLMHGYLWHWRGFNVLFTLLLGLLGIRAIDTYSRVKSSCFVGALFVVALVVGVDYGLRGLAFIMLLHLLRQRRLYQAIAAGSMFMGKITSICAILAFIPIGLYNGQRGFIHGKVGKYLFYSFYPLHLLLIYLCAS